MAQQGQYAQLGQRAKHPGTLADYKRNFAADLRGVSEREIREQWQTLMYEYEESREPSDQPPMRKFYRKGLMVDRDNNDHDFDTPAMAAGWATCTPLGTQFMTSNYDHHWQQLARWTMRRGLPVQRQKPHLVR